ncbi:MAG: PepSY-associated TM helix domain-containing protein [Planctomycetota bacterium]
MDNSKLLKADRVLRWIHLYTGLFLLPWMIVYGMSAFCLNHNQWLIKQLNVTPPHWETVRQVDFVPDDMFPHEPAQQARAILEMLDLDGAHNIVGEPNRNQMVINRVCGTGNYRITWQPPRSQIIVEKQKSFSFYRLMHFLHFRGGYIQPYFVNIAWAVIVDCVAVSMWLWVFSGVYLWWRRSRKLLLGWASLIVGLLSFLGLVVLFCR